MNLRTLLESRTLELAKKRGESLDVELSLIDETAMNHWGVELNGIMTFKSGFSDTDSFFNVVKNKYVTKSKIKCSIGNGMSGSATIFFDYNKLKEVTVILKKDGWNPIEVERKK